MKKQVFILTLLLFFGVGLYAQPKVVGEPRVIAKTSEPLQKPLWSADGKTLSFNNGQWEVSHDGTSLKKVTVATDAKRKPSANALLQKMIADPAKVASQVEGLKSLSGCILFNATLSPKGDQIVFQASYGKGLFVCNADGSGLRSLGQGSRATWTSDGKFIVAGKTEDDGHEITKGELVSISVADGAQSILLSSDKYIALSPTISPDGKKLAFEEYASGAIYVIDIQ